MSARYEVLTAAAKMPSSCWGRYRRVAVVELADGYECAPRIDARSKAIKRIVWTWEKCHVGSTARCAYRRALADAYALVARLTAEGGA